MNVSIRLDYENTLLGRQTTYKIAKKEADKGEINDRILSLLHYVFDELLEWSPSMVRDYLNWDVIEWLHLTSVINKIEFPPELDSRTDLFYIAALMYPKEITYQKRDFTLQVYEKVMSGDLIKYPKGFFSSAEGIENLQICFRYAVRQKLYNKSLKELYLFFSDYQPARKFISNANLSLPYSKHYDLPLDLFHDSLHISERSEFYYHYAKFKYCVKMVKEKML